MATSKKQFDFKKTFTELEKIADWFESEDIDLAKGLTEYERGMKLIKEAQKHLKETENKLKKI